MTANAVEIASQPAPQNDDTRFQTDNSVSKKAQPKQQLSKSMQHMLYAVTADPIPHSSTPTPPTDPSDSTISPPPTTQYQDQPPPENDAYGVPASFAPTRNPPSRSHDPSNNQKRTDPFAFGSRYLEEGDNIFEFNAWDHVTVDPTYEAFSLEQYSKQRAEPVSDFDKGRYNAQPEKWWNQFYKNNKTNFFKNRKWLKQEFPVLGEVGGKDAGEAVVLEVGAGAGNSAFPILQNSENPKLKIHACDFSKKAVELIRGHELYGSDNIQADVWDVAASPDSENNGLPPGLSEGSVDVVLMIFIFSALNPTQWDQAVRNIYRVLKPGGQVLFRDYGRGDLAQVRFKKGRYMEENFYVRGDGTRVYFFEKEELEEIWGGRISTPSEDTEQAQTEEKLQPDAEKSSDGQPRTQPSELVQALVQETGNISLLESSARHKQDRETQQIQQQDARPTFEIAHIGVDRRMLVNRQRRLKMYRCWMQAVFRKPGNESNIATSTLKESATEEENVEEAVEA